MSDALRAALAAVNPRLAIVWRAAVVVAACIPVVVGCGTERGNDDVQGSCLPPGPDQVPFKCDFNCLCGSGGRCEQGRCVSCGCNSDELCTSTGRCIDAGGELWYSGALGYDRRHGSSAQQGSGPLP
jgi:hypothetical protein